LGKQANCSRRAGSSAPRTRLFSQLRRKCLERKQTAIEQVYHLLVKECKAYVGTVFLGVKSVSIKLGSFILRSSGRAGDRKCPLIVLNMKSGGCVLLGGLKLNLGRKYGEGGIFGEFVNSAGAYQNNNLITTGPVIKKGFFGALTTRSGPDPSSC